MTYYTDGGGGDTGNSGGGQMSGDQAGMWLIDNVNQMASAARSGQIAVDENGGQALLAALDDMRTWYRENSRALQELAQADGYGTSHGARVVQPFMGQVADDQQGLLTVLLAMDKALAEAEQAIRDAMRNYQETEANNADAARKVSGGLPDGADGDTYYV